MNEPEGLRATNSFDSAPPPVRGLNLSDALSRQTAMDALVAENVVCYPDRVETRKGAAEWSTGYANAVRGLWAYTGATPKLWATTDAGIFDATSAGAVGAAAIALTNGYTNAAILSTGAGTFLSVVNGSDTLKQYDGTSWTSVALFGTLATQNIAAIETYKQRYYMLEKGTLNLHYLAVNSISGAATAYPLGAIFRRGGSVTALATWTLDGGNGPDDHLVVVTSEGEVAVFSGTDPSSPATWSLRGVYYIGRPMGTNCLFKFGGELLYLQESGLFPLSRALQSASIDKTPAITYKVQQLFAQLTSTYGVNTGWQVLSLPDIPLLLVNIPGVAAGFQLAMHAQSGAWSSFTGWEALCLVRFQGELYFGKATSVAKGWSGGDDFGSAIVASCMSAFHRLRYANNKQVDMVRPVFKSNGAFSYTVGIANDFDPNPTQSLVVGSAASSTWGSGIWGSAVWTSSALLTREWRTVSDKPGVYKSLFWQVSTTGPQVALQNIDFLFQKLGKF